MAEPKKVFISYSKSDKDYLEALKKHLSSLKRQGMLTTWDDTDLLPGETWDAAIRRELNAADIIILLVSADLMATDYIWDVEMKAALERHARGEVTVIPVIIRPSVWEETPFAHLNALPEKGKPIAKWDDQDEGWAQVVMKIKGLFQKKSATPDNLAADTAQANDAAQKEAEPSIVVTNSKNMVIGSQINTGGGAFIIGDNH